MVVNIDWLQLSIYKIEDGHHLTKKDPITIAMLGSGGVVEFLDNQGGEYPKLKFTPKSELLSDAFLYYAEDDFIYLGELMLQRCDLREGLLKIDNALLYTHNMARDNNLYKIIMAALDNSGWMFKHVTRCDICADFNPINTPICGKYKDAPGFIKDIINCHVKRCSMGAGRATVSTQTVRREKREGEKQKIVQSAGRFSYIRFSNYLPTSVLYNKSLEFRSKSLKPYISEFWQAAGMDDTAGDIWRLELRFNFKGSAWSENVCCRLHEAFTSSPAPLNFILSVVNEYVLDRLSFKTRLDSKKNPFFDRETILNGSVTDCNLTEYKLYAKLPRVSSYHIGLCKYLRGFLSDVERFGGNKNAVPVEAITEAADFIMSECENLILYRQGLDIKSYIKGSFYAVGAAAVSSTSTPRAYYEALTEDGRRKLLEISILQGEIKTAQKIRRLAERIGSAKLQDYITLKGDLAGAHGSPVK